MTRGLAPRFSLPRESGTKEKRARGGGSRKGEKRGSARCVDQSPFYINSVLVESASRVEALRQKVWSLEQFRSNQIRVQTFGL